MGGVGWGGVGPGGVGWGSLASGLRPCRRWNSFSDARLADVGVSLPATAATRACFDLSGFRTTALRCSRSSARAARASRAFKPFVCSSISFLQSSFEAAIRRCRSFGVSPSCGPRRVEG